MKKNILLTAVTLAGMLAASSAFARVNLDVNIGEPAPVYIAPAPVYAVPGPAVIVNPYRPGYDRWHREHDYRYWQQRHWEEQHHDHWR